MALEVENNPKILSTTRLEPLLIQKAKEEGIDIDAIDFIKIVSINDASVIDRIVNALQSQEALVFTSANAVNEIGKYYKESNHEPKIFCIGKKTKKTVEQYFDSSLIYSWANDAEELAKEILESGIKSIAFFCGDKRMDTLPTILHKTGIAVEEIVVYKTIESPEPIINIYDAILFYSPSCVNSYFSVNTIFPNTVLFAIGTTTANALHNKVSNKVVICNEPQKEQVVADAIAYFQKVEK